MWPCSHPGHTLFSTRLTQYCRKGVRSQERMLQSYILWTLMTSQKPWLTARDLHKVKPVNIPARRRKASPLGRELSAIAEKGRGSLLQQCGRLSMFHWVAPYTHVHTNSTEWVDGRGRRRGERRKRTTKQEEVGRIRWCGKSQRGSNKCGYNLNKLYSCIQLLKNKSKIKRLKSQEYKHL